MSFTRSPRKNWNHTRSQAQALYGIMEKILRPLGSAALVTPSGQALHIHPTAPIDIATLPAAAQLCHQYLQLGDGDVAILNDPYSGGTTLNEITLVTGVSFDPQTPVSQTDLLIAHRITLPTRLPEGNSLDDEGVRIPPMPLGKVGKLNTDLLAAIGAHPLAPQGLADEIKKSDEKLSSAIQQIKRLGTDPGTEFRSANFKSYLIESRQAFKAFLSRLPLGSALVTTQIPPSGEMVKLRMDFSEDRLIFDFAGSDDSTQISLTELTTLGACVAATLSTLSQDTGYDVPLNAGTLEYFQVSASTKTLLSGRAPQGVFRGMNFGVAAVCSLVQTALGQLNPAMRSAKSAGSHSFFQFEFSDGRVFTDKAAPGSGARQNMSGTDSVASWGRNRTHQESSEQSSEELESKYPLQVSSKGYSSQSVGNGRKRGGRGESKAYVLLSPATLRWELGAQSQPQEGLANGHAGSVASITVIRQKSGAEETLTSFSGSVSLDEGDEVRISAAGGGGFGEPKGES